TYQAWRRYGVARALVVAMMALFLLPVLWGIGFGQVHLVVLAIILAGMLLISHNHEYAGGAVLGFGGVLKYFPAVLILYYLLCGRWRSVIGATVASIALVVTQWLIVGPQTLVESIGAGQRDVRYFAALEEGGHWMNSLLGGVLIGYFTGLTFVVIVVWLRWSRGKRTANEEVGAGWALTTMLLLSQLVWWHYLTWLLPALMVCLDVALLYAKRPVIGQNWRSLASHWWPVVTLGIAYCLLNIIPFHLPHPLFRASAAGTLLLWVLCGALYLWSAGVRLPSNFALARLWRRASADVAPATKGGVTAASFQPLD
ncbi:MAG TPA: glycosyltransferase family 87 protein, partial [Ktedonobacterales bacterium]|nr:glycosyltransferase family 87 protein [Ktedonobacterales bacterium]